MKYDNEFIDRYRDIAGRSDCAAFYTFVRNDGVSRFHANCLLRDLFNCSLEDCLRVMRDCGDDPKCPVSNDKPTG